MNTAWQRCVAAHPRAADAAVALVLFAVTIPGSQLSTTDPGSRISWWTAAPIAAVGCAALMWRRSRPKTVVAVTTACSMAASALGVLLTPLLLGPVMAALYWLSLTADRRTIRICTLATAALLAATALIADPVNHPFALKTLNPVAWVLLPPVYGTAIRMRRAYLKAVEARAEFAERTREEEARHRVAEERMRIARDLHDVVAHHLALANAQAGTAAHLARTDPVQTQKILDDLAGTTSSALRELKATVGLLRQANDTDTPLEPSPGLARLDDLTASFASAGLTVTVTTEGEPQELSPGVDLTAFRIVQEALTNVAKHAGTKAAHIELAHTSAGLTVTVTDEGPAEGSTVAPAGEAAGRGFGLIGMRERAHSVGGHLHTGRRPEGGFEVTAHLPLHSRNPEEDRTP
ncbi:sensor histidine kinase [Streptomyces sp. NPDC057136]|uniref:sensor histidine kinase n=1 Tax=Streptomyces sp. NPDC057136 TaxID=3346029 RepID=UPI00363BD046